MTELIAALTFTPDKAAMESPSPACWATAGRGVVILERVRVGRLPAGRGRVHVLKRIGLNKTEPGITVSITEHGPVLLKFDSRPPQSAVENGDLFPETFTPPSCPFPSASPAERVMPTPPVGPGSL